MSRLSALLLVVGLTAAAGLWWLGGRLATGSPARVGPPPACLSAETIHIDSSSGSRLAGWYAPGQAGRGGVLLLHGSGGDRRSMLGRARFLHRAGHAVLLIDFQAHGESPGRYNTLGYQEARDAEAALDWLALRLPGERLAIVGFSLGGAAPLLGKAAEAADALVLEAVYTDLETAVGNRIALRLGDVFRPLAPLLTLQYRPRMGFSSDELAPVERLGDLSTPLLIVGGEQDLRATETDTRLLFATANEPKQLWLLPGATHQDFHAFTPRDYEQRVGGFLARHLVAE